MDRYIRYQLLPNEEARTAPVEDVQLAAVVPPPAYVQIEQDNAQSAPEAAACGGPAPPSYKVATELPSYDEAERIKKEEAEANVESPIDPQTERQQVHDPLTGMSLGTDCIFLCTFVMSFLFNWIGFFLSLCLSNTVAGRCGALSGLGLSIVKWAAILKQSEWVTDYVSDSDGWIWWVLMFCGFVVFFRGCIQYFQIKYEWKKVTGQITRFRLFN